MVLHQANDVPLTVDQGLDILPSTATSLGIEVTEINRLPRPYHSQCITEWNETNLPQAKGDKDKETSSSSSGHDDEAQHQKPPGYSMVLCGRVCILNHIKGDGW